VVSIKSLIAAAPTVLATSAAPGGHSLLPF
jgi:hypothetical protein